MKYSNPSELADRIEDALQRGDLNEALELSDRGIRTFPKSADLWALRAETLDEIGEIADSIEAYTKALKFAPDWGYGYSRRSSLFIELGNLEIARKDIEKSLVLDRNDPEAIFNIAIINELEGNDFNAWANYKRASEIDPIIYYKPIRVRRNLFEEMVNIAIDKLPQKLKDYVLNIPIIIHDLPEKNKRGRWKSINPLILGEIIGEAVPEKAMLDPWSCFPSTIILYKKNIERGCRNTGELLREIKNIIVNEILCFLGFEEDEIEEIINE